MLDPTKRPQDLLDECHQREIRLTMEYKVLATQIKRLHIRRAAIVKKIQKLRYRVKICNAHMANRQSPK